MPFECKMITSPHPNLGLQNFCLDNKNNNEGGGSIPPLPPDQKKRQE